MKIKTTATIAGLLALAASPAGAGDTALKAQLETLKAQMQAMQAQITTLEKQLAEKRPEGAPPTPAAPANAVKVSLAPGPKFETADGEYSFKLGGFAQIDAGIFNDDIVDQPNGTTIRRARLNVSGNLTRDFRYKLENDFANNASAITDAYLEYLGLAPVSFMVGQFKEPFSLETLTSDLFTTFTERALPFAFAPDRNIGFAVSDYGTTSLGAWTLTAGGFGSGTGVASTDDEARDFTARATFAPIAEAGKLLHFGVAGSYRVPDNASDSMRFQSRPETRLTSAQSVDSGSISQVDHTNLLGLEAAAVWGPASLQGEYMRADVNREMGFADAVFDGYYAEASYFLTGESRVYLPQYAKFDRVTPLHPFSLSGGGWGAWQLAARYSALDLTDNAIRGGVMDDITLGLRWYPLANVSLLFNYIRSDSDSDAVTPNDDPQAFILRTQFDF